MFVTQLAEARTETDKIDTGGADDKRKNKEPYLINLNEDPMLSGVICHFLNNGETSVGRKDASPVPNICLSGLRWGHTIGDSDLQQAYLKNEMLYPLTFFLHLHLSTSRGFCLESNVEANCSILWHEDWGIILNIWPIIWIYRHYVSSKCISMNLFPCIQHSEAACSNL